MSQKQVYRDRCKAVSRAGRAAIAWHLQPLPDARLSYSREAPQTGALAHAFMNVTRQT